jgi:hypothetical protein
MPGKNLNYIVTASFQVSSSLILPVDKEQLAYCHLRSVTLHNLLTVDN